MRKESEWRETLSYMAPETYEGKPVKESDQYALAILVYEWLCGRVPFTEGNFIQLGYQHSHEPVPPLREKNLVIPPEVEAVVMKALSKDRKDRFTSVQTFVHAFERACRPPLPVKEPQPDQSIQARQAGQERLRHAEKAEQALLVVEGQNTTEQVSPMLSQTFPPTASPHATLPPQSSAVLPPLPSSRQHTRLRSPTIVIVLILLVLMLCKFWNSVNRILTTR